MEDKFKKSKTESDYHEEPRQQTRRRMMATDEAKDDVGTINDCSLSSSFVLFTVLHNIL